MSGYQRSNRVLLMRLAVRTSGKGNAYLSGWLGKARVVAFMGEPDQHGNECWDVYVSEPEPRQDAQEPRQASEHTRSASRAGEAPAARNGPARREGSGSRQERAARNALERYGNPGLDDAVDLP